jgi:hypothetical protein
MRSLKKSNPLIPGAGVCDPHGHIFQTFTCRLTNVPETLDLWLEFTGAGSDLLRLDWFKFFEEQYYG